VHSRIACRASCAKHPKWHNWHIGTAVPTHLVARGVPLTARWPDTPCKSAPLSLAEIQSRLSFAIPSPLLLALQRCLQLVCQESRQAHCLVGSWRLGGLSDGVHYGC
jgi:hypothetical protein